MIYVIKLSHIFDLLLKVYFSSDLASELSLHPLQLSIEHFLIMVQYHVTRQGAHGCYTQLSSNTEWTIDSFSHFVFVMVWSLSAAGQV